MEDFVLKKMRELIGWSGGDSILAPGKMLLIGLIKIKSWTGQFHLGTLRNCFM